MRVSGKVVLLGSAITLLAGCLVPQVHYNRADGWSVDWKSRQRIEDEAEDPFAGSFREGYGFNNEKNAQQAMERARNR